jgi:DNA-binding NarL/FixJ family response regulator
MGTLAPTTASPDPSALSLPDLDVRVVICDGRHDRRQLMSYVVEQGGDHVTVVGFADDPASAVEAVDRLSANAVVVEIQLPVARGLDTISALRHDFPALRIIVCSFHDDAQTKCSALAHGADAYLVKPLSPRDLHRLLPAASCNS